MDKWFEPVPFAARICLSALGGCVSGWLFFSLVSTARPGHVLYNIYDAFLGGLIFVPFAFVLITPLLLVALVLGAIFHRQVAKRPVAWAIGACLATWITTLVGIFFTESKNQWWMTHSNAERLIYVITCSDSMLFLSGAVGAGATFYMIGLIRLDRRQLG